MLILDKYYIFLKFDAVKLKYNISQEGLVLEEL
jgi:hypothetical protein